MASLKYIMLLQRDVQKAVKFYGEGLGLNIVMCTENWAEMKSGNMTIALKQVANEAHVSTGYSPFLFFEVNDFDKTILRLLKLGAILDGPIKYPQIGKVASLRAPDGQMIALQEKLEVKAKAEP